MNTLNFNIKTTIYRTLFVLLTLLVLPAFGQQSLNSLLNTGKKNTAKLNYPVAIKAYKGALALEPANAKALEGLIEIYLNRYEIYDSAKVYIDKRISSMEENENPLIYFENANCLRLQEKPYEAIEQYLYFKANGLSESKYEYLSKEVSQHLATCRFAIKNREEQVDNNTYSVENMDFFINSVDSEYTPVYIEEENLLLYNARYKDFETEEVTVDNKYYENIYYFDLEESVASSYNPGIEQANHHAVIGRAGQSDTILIFFQNNIWVSAIKDDRLNDIKPLPEALRKFWFQPHGIFSNNGNTFIFSAMTKPEMEGGHRDIYISNKVNGEWEAPKLISPLINSEADDDSPFLSEDGKTLYFSSKGHNSSGGYDFFKSEMVNGQWTYPENLGYPMNSAGDDIYLTFTKDGKAGFFSSNRTGGFGGMDIYRFDIDKKTILGTAHDKAGQPLAGVDVTLFNVTDGTELYTTSDETGAFEFDVDADKEFTLLGEKEDYFDGGSKTNTLLAEKEVNVELMLEKDPGISILTLVTDKKTNEPLDSVAMTITDNMTGATETYLTTKTGDYRKPLAGKKLNDRGSFNFTFEKEGYLSKTITYNALFDEEGVYNVHTDLDLTLEKISVGENLSDIIDIRPIYFDVNKALIKPEAALELDKIVKVLNENPNMMIELGSHTDSRGSASSNLSLSERRALASADYIKERITNPDRISAKGYGESRLVNKCADGVTCTKEQHQENRRTEFIIIRL